MIKKILPLTVLLLINDLLYFQCVCVCVVQKHQIPHFRWKDTSVGAGNQVWFLCRINKIS